MRPQSRYFQTRRAGGRWIAVLRPDSVLFTTEALWRALLSLAYGAELDYGNRITTICSLSTMQGYNLKDYSLMKLAATSLDDTE